MRNWTSDLRIPRSDALPLSHRDSTVSEVYYEVHIRRVLHTARISSVDSVMFGNRIREMESFDLGKEKEKDIFVYLQIEVLFQMSLKKVTLQIYSPD